MNKKRVDSWLLKAKEALVLTEIVEDGTVEKTYRSQIVAFGAAVVIGSLPSAVAFFSNRGSASVSRTKLLRAMYYCISGELLNEKQILRIVCENNSTHLREQFTDASIALKLAMSFFELVQKG